MSDLLNLLRTRRSIRTFSDRPITKEQRQQLEEALHRAPTSRGRNPWHFIFIDDPELLKQAAGAKEHGSAFIGKAKLAVVICADEEISDVWVEDCAIAAITLQYAAHDLGLGSCWAQIRERQHDADSSAENYLQKLLDIPARFRIASVIGIGQPDEEKEGHKSAELPQGKIHQNRF